MNWQGLKNKLPAVTCRAVIVPAGGTWWKNRKCK